jgi:hypothetical protein
MKNCTAQLEHHPIKNVTENANFIHVEITPKVLLSCFLLNFISCNLIKLL